jgi:hypothetical protein
MHALLTAFWHIVEGWAAFLALLIGGAYTVAAITQRIRNRNNH